MNDKLLLTFNAGSSTIKIGLFTVEDGSLRQTGRGKIDFRETPLRLELSDGPDRLDIILEAEQDEELDTVISETFSRLARHYDLSNVVAIGHRVVHGGDIFDGPVFVDDKTIIQMQALVPLAPLHQSQAMHLIHAIRRASGRTFPRQLLSTPPSTVPTPTSFDVLRFRERCTTRGSNAMASMAFRTSLSLAP